MHGKYTANNSSVKDQCEYVLGGTEGCSSENLHRETPKVNSNIFYPDGYFNLDVSVFHAFTCALHPQFPGWVTGYDIVMYVLFSAPTLVSHVK